MLQVRRSGERGKSRTSWLDSRHSFSFADYYDPQHMGFSVLRVINDDRIAPSSGFATHGHRDMEIITYMLQGTLKHTDSMGNVSLLKAGEVQRMSAGTGIRHSETNPSDAEPVHLLQIWIEPDQRGLTPSYQEQRVNLSNGSQFRLLISPSGEEGSLSIHQDASLYSLNVDAGEQLSRDLDPQRRVYVHVVSGDMNINGQSLSAGDAVALEAETTLSLEAASRAEALYFDLP